MAFLTDTYWAEPMEETQPSLFKHAMEDSFVLVVSVDDHPVGVFATEAGIFNRFPELKFKQLSSGYWTAKTEQLNTVYVERFKIQ